MPTEGRRPARTGMYRDTPSMRGALGVEAIVHHLMMHEIDFACELREDGPSKLLRLSTAQETENATNPLDVDSAIKSLRIADRIGRKAVAAGEAVDS
jgi:hypothetical protein